MMMGSGVTVSCMVRKQYAPPATVSTHRAQTLHVAALMGVEGFGGRLGDSRRAKGQRLRRDYKPAELARDAGVTSATISRWENGEVLPDVATMARLAKI